MTAAKEIFDTLRRYRVSPEPGKSPEQSLVDYCKNVLGPVERVHFDFKSKAKPENPTPDDSDIKNLAKAVSGFANGAGGALIWGIEDSSVESQPIAGVAEFLGTLLQRSHQITAPTVIGIDGDYILADSKAESGFAVILVPESDLPPHRVVSQIKEVQNHYYVRSGSSFTVATHSQLEDMFGRRPRPNLSLFIQCDGLNPDGEIWLTVFLENTGRGIARYPYLELEIDKPYGISEWGADGNGHFGLPVISKASGFRPMGITLYGSMDFGSQDGFVLHSGMRHRITKLAWYPAKDKAYQSKELRIRYRVAAEGLPLRAYEKTMTEAQLVQTMTPR
jgi:hypothetical protein